MNYDLKKIINQGEEILYEIKPNKKYYIFKSIFNFLLPIAVVCFTINCFIFNGVQKKNFFVLLHLIPIIIYLCGVIFTIIKYNNTNYIITNSAIYVSTGIFIKKINTKRFVEISSIDLHVNLFEQIFGVGDVIMISGNFLYHSKDEEISISDISNYLDIYNLVNKIHNSLHNDTKNLTKYKDKSNIIKK